MMHEHLHKDSPIIKFKKLYEEKNHFWDWWVCAYDSNSWDLRKENVRLRLVWAIVKNKSTRKERHKRGKWL